jgi:hypothetical protein
LLRGVLREVEANWADSFLMLTFARSAPALFLLSFFSSWRWANLAAFWMNVLVP